MSIRGLDLIYNIESVFLTQEKSGKTRLKAIELFPEHVLLRARVNKVAVFSVVFGDKETPLEDLLERSVSGDKKEKKIIRYKLKKAVSLDLDLAALNTEKASSSWRDFCGHRNVKKAIRDLSQCV